MRKKDAIRPVSVVPGDDRKIAEKPVRRKFSWGYKKTILDEIEANRETRGSIGQILRREGLYAGQVATWREEAEARAAGHYKPKKRGRKPDPDRDLKIEVARLKQQNARLRKELHISQTLNELQKKVADMFAEDNIDS